MRLFKKSFLKNEEGVSPVVGALLMVMVVVAAFSAIYVFVLDYTANRKIVYTQFFTESIEEAKERFVIEDVWFTSDNGNNNKIDIYLRNVGKIKINITSVTIMDNNSNTLEITLSPPYLILDVGEHGWLNATLVSSSWQADTQYHVTVETERGNSIEGYYKSPKE